MCASNAATAAASGTLTNVCIFLPTVAVAADVADAAAAAAAVACSAASNCALLMHEPDEQAWVLLGSRDTVNDDGVVVVVVDNDDCVVGRSPRTAIRASSPLRTACTICDSTVAGGVNVVVVGSGGSAAAAEAVAVADGNTASRSTSEPPSLSTWTTQRSDSAGRCTKAASKAQTAWSKASEEVKAERKAGEVKNVDGVTAVEGEEEKEMASAILAEAISGELHFSSTSKLQQQQQQQGHNHHRHCRDGLLCNQEHRTEAHLAAVHMRTPV